MPLQLIPILQDGSISGPEVILPEVALPVIAGTRQIYERVGYVEPWVGYIAIENGKCAGSCGFTSPPVENLVEIAYFTFPGFEKRGIATRMAQQLISIARTGDPSVKIVAHTLAEEDASTCVLRKNGFVFDGVINQPEDGDIWKWSYDQKFNPP